MSLHYCPCGTFVSTSALTTSCPRCSRLLSGEHRIQPSQIVELLAALGKRLPASPVALRRPCPIVTPTISHEESHDARHLWNHHT